MTIAGGARRGTLEGQSILVVFGMVLSSHTPSPSIRPRRPDTLTAEDAKGDRGYTRVNPALPLTVECYTEFQRLRKKL
jgi:hypothetical protein